MNNSIQHFVENGIPELEKNKKDFLVLDFGCHIISEALEECNILLEKSLKRIMHWQIKDHGQKSIMSPIGMLSFTRTRFKNKETKETAYLLDRAVGIEPHVRMSDGVKAKKEEEEKYFNSSNYLHGRKNIIKQMRNI